MFAGGVIILLAGTEYLNALWLLLLIAITVATAVYIALRKRPSTYRVAQRIDAKLHLHDTLSTAAHFLEAPGTEDAAIRESQRLHAERTAQSVDLKQALPLVRPRALYPAVGLALALAAVLLLRYAVLGTFNPHSSLVASAYDNVFGPAKQQAKLAGSPEGGDQPGDSREASKEAQKNSDFAGEPSANFDPTTAQNQQKQNQQEAINKDQGAGAGKKEDSPGKESSSDEQKQGDKRQADGNQNTKSTPDPSLLSKVREALNDMLNKMKSSPNDQGKNQKSDPTDSDQQPGQDGQSQEKGDGQQAQNGKQSSDAQDGSNNSQNQKSNEAKNGIGSQEGDKATKQAEALKAMGKITELLGKRAENVKGAVMVEVGSTKQQLKTPVGQNQSTHAEAGSEIHRDEVPPIYQQFVQQYYERIRKTPQGSPPGISPAPK
ncbi:MAG: hypothetical protein M3O20_09520 [Acidobacteriota bacterium]|nr:hypothetical protein [Acidobacteriota bacterium]